jgi:hypothetical protein
MAQPRMNCTPARVRFLHDAAAPQSEVRREKVLQLAEEMGFRPFDVGPLARARSLEGMASSTSWSTRRRLVLGDGLEAAGPNQAKSFSGLHSASAGYCSASICRRSPGRPKE